MPRQSQRAQLLAAYWSFFIDSLAAEGLSDKTLQWLAIWANLDGRRYIEPCSAIPKSTFAAAVFPELPADRFRGFMRMDRCFFAQVLDLIKDDAIFINNSSQEQTPVFLQLQYILYQLGHDGNSKSFMNTATFWGVSEGHIYNCSKRVIKALCNIRDVFVRWPDASKRVLESLRNDTREGFIGAIGKVDGTDIVLHYKPGGKYLGETFWNQKKRYALDLCAVCDSSKSFTYMLAGWPNSAHNARVFASTSLHREPDAYFSAGKYLLGDAA